MKSLVLSLVCLVAMLSTAAALEPYYSFQPKGGTTKIPAAFQAWHAQFEDDKDYGESWFFFTQTNDGAVLFAMLSITNLGLRTFEGTVDAQFYTPDGKVHNAHKEYKRDKVTASTDKMDVKIGHNYVTGGGGVYKIGIEEAGMKLDLTLKNVLPPYMFGNGKVEFYKDRSAEWTMGLNVPRGASAGSLSVDGKSYDLAGTGYHDHGWATVKLPDIFTSWYTLRAYDSKYAFVLHKQKMEKDFGGKVHQFGLFGVDGKLKGALRNFSFSPTQQVKDKKSKYTIPTAFNLALKTGEYTVKGTVTRTRHLDTLDVLGQVSWPVRVVIKAFYSNPFMHRYLAKLELDVTDKDGNTEHVSTLGVVEANFF